MFFSCQNKNIDKSIVEHIPTKKDSISTSIKKVDVKNHYTHELPLGIISIKGDYISINLELLDSNYVLVKELNFKDEYSIKSFFCYSIDNLYYQIEYENIKYWVLKNNPNLKFQTIQNHILSDVFSVSFDEKTNLIKEFPDSNSKTIDFIPDEFYLPVTIKNDWLKIKWGYEDNYKYGWIKWKENDKLIIELFYFA